jgi:hypothetical protein
LRGNGLQFKLAHNKQAAYKTDCQSLSLHHRGA